MAWKSLSFCLRLLSAVIIGMCHHCQYLNIILKSRGQELVAYTCTLNYSGSRDQEVCSLKPAWENSSRDPAMENPSQKRVGGMSESVGPEFKPQYL
jgi:hypothetical protein